MQYRNLQKTSKALPRQMGIIPMVDDSETSEWPQVIPENHQVSVSDRMVSVDNKRLVQHNINTDTVTLVLDGEWDGLKPVLILGEGEKKVRLEWLGEPIVIPSSVAEETGTVAVSVVGLDTEGLTRLVTVRAPSIFEVVASGEYFGDIPPDEQPDLLVKIIDAADDAHEAADEAREASKDIKDPIAVGNGAPSGDMNSSMYLDIETYDLYNRV